MAGQVLWSIRLGLVMVLTVLCRETYAVTLLRRNLTDYSLAKCNDGSPAAYFYQEDTRRSSDKVLVYLPGGGDCSSIEECQERCSMTSSLCSRPTSDVMEMPNSGIWHSDININPLADFFKVSLHYCSSDSFAGSRGGSKSTENLFFHGKHILTASLQDLIKRFGLADARQVVLAGSGSGARGVGLNCDFVSEAFRALSPDTDVRCLMDGGDFTPWWVTTEEEKCKGENFNRLEGEKFLWGRKDDESCLELTENKSNSTELAHKCGVLSRYWPTISTPSMLIAPQLDPNLFHANPCAPDSDDPEYSSYELAWRRGMVALSESLTARTQTAASKLSLFVPSCSSPSSTYLSSSTEMEVPLVRGNRNVTLANTLASWLRGGYLQAVEPVGRENSKCPSPISSAPLTGAAGCSSLLSCKGKGLYRTGTTRRLHPPSYLYPRGYGRSCSLDPWYSGCSRRHQAAVSGASGRGKLWQKYYMLQYLRQLYKKWKSAYAREYHGTLAGRKPLVPVTRPVPVPVPVPVKESFSGLGPIGPALGSVDFDYLDYDYLGDYADYYNPGFGTGLLEGAGTCGTCGGPVEKGLSESFLTDVLGEGCGGSCDNFLARIVKAVQVKKNRRNRKQSGGGNVIQKTQIIKKEADKKIKVEEEDEEDFLKFFSEANLDYEDFGPLSSQVETFEGEAVKPIKLREKPPQSDKSDAR